MSQIVLYKNVAKEKTIDKTSFLTILKTLNGTYRNIVDVMNPIIDIEIYANIEDNLVFTQCNYAYLEDFKRYYFIIKYEYLKNIVRLYLKIDVLYTHKTFINYQTIHVRRIGNNYLSSGERLVPDEKRGVTNEKEIIEHSLVNLSENPITFNPLISNNNTGKLSVCVAVWNDGISHTFISGRSPYIPSAIPELPSINTAVFAPENLEIFFPDEEELCYILSYASKSATFASHIASIHAFPFDVHDIVLDNQFLDTRYFKSGDEFLVIDNHGTKLECKTLSQGTITPYIEFFKFVVPNNPQDFNDLEPYSLWELFIPYLGWITLPYNTVRGHTLSVYYNINWTDGSSNVYVYDNTKKLVIYSSMCELGIEIGTTVSNKREVDNRRSANATNLVLNALSSIIQVALGVASSNPLPIATGVMSGVKGFTGFVENDKTNLMASSRRVGNSVAHLYETQTLKLKQTRKKIRIKRTDVLQFQFFLEQEGTAVNFITDLSVPNSQKLYDYVEGDINHFILDNFVSHYPNDVIPLNEEMEEIRTLFNTGVIFPPYVE